jgi:hypothetical protein
MLATAARADQPQDKADSSDAKEDLILVNATAKLGSIGAIDRVRRVLDARGLVKRLPDALEAVLDGRGVGVPDIDQIKEDFSNGDFKAASKLIDADEKRVLLGVASGDPIPALAELASWRGLVAASQGDEDGALTWFRAAVRLNPAWSPDKKLATSPTVRRMFKAAKQPTENGRLRVDIDPEDAQVRVDGGAIHAAREKIELNAGMHLVIVSAENHAPYAEMVEITEGKTEKLSLTLDKENKDDRAARLVDATVSAPAGKSRLKSAKPLSKLTGARRMLYVEDASDDRVVLRLYDLDAKKVSQTIELGSDATSAAITRKVLAALDTDNMIDPSSVVVIDRTTPSAWYNHWYVWAGVALVAGAAFGAYEYESRSPTAVRF